MSETPEQRRRACVYGGRQGDRGHMLRVFFDRRERAIEQAFARFARASADVINRGVRR